MQKHCEIRRDGEMREEISKCWRESKDGGERRSPRREDGFLLIVKGSLPSEQSLG